MGKTVFAETCEGMLSLNNDELRPEVACATAVSGKVDTSCIASKHRRAKMVNNCCVAGCTSALRSGCTSALRRQMELVSVGSRWLIEVEQQKAAAARRDHWEPKAHTRICGEHFKTGNDLSVVITVVYLHFHSLYYLFPNVLCMYVVLRLCHV